jgi:hypothetical protein
LLVYFTTGGASLAVAASELTPEEKNYLDQVWYYLSQQEIGALCAVCCRTGTAATPAVNGGTKPSTSVASR